tara:strand:- start:413 stop:787 length:375 start_codon:yes stop_codon:yes gene_type:complete
VIVVKKVYDTDDSHLGVFLEEPRQVGDIIINLASHGKQISEPTRTSIQVSEHVHVEDFYGAFVNHSCDPSCRVSGYHIIALRDLEVGDQITFNYNKNETKLAAPFLCDCCSKLIEGETMKWLKS